MSAAYLQISLSEYLRSNIPLLIVFLLIGILILVLAFLLIYELICEKKKKQSASLEQEYRQEPNEIKERTIDESAAEDELNQDELEPDDSKRNEVKQDELTQDEAEPDDSKRDEVKQDKLTQDESIPDDSKRDEVIQNDLTQDEAEEDDKAIVSKEVNSMKNSEKTDKKLEKTAEKKTTTSVKDASERASGGKWIIYEEERGGYGFKLLASNGEIMLKSSAPYASLGSAKVGIKTYQDNIAAKRLEIIETKKGNFFVQINNANNRLLATSADYKTRTGCESAAESIQRWAPATLILIENETREEKK